MNFFKPKHENSGLILFGILELILQRNIHHMMSKVCEVFCIGVKRQGSFKADFTAFKQVT